MREFGSEHPAITLPDGYFERLKELKREVTFLRSGREALLYASLNVIKGIRDVQNSSKVILFPAYCCWSMSAPFEKSGWEVVYYRLHEDLTVDVEYLEGLLDQYNPKAMLTMNFYGSAETNKAIAKAKEICPKIISIEDFSHCTFSLKKIFNSPVDYYVSSIRKSIGVCDGAVVLSKTPTDRGVIQSEIKDFSDVRLNAQREKGRYFYSKDPEYKSRFLPAIKEGEKIIDDFSVVRPISDTAKKQLDQINGKEIAFARRENMKHLWHLLQGKVRMVPGLERCFDGAPFALPILEKKQLEVQQRLAKRGVYTQVLWPICEEAQRVCPVSKMMGEEMLSVPIDQRLSWDDIEDIARIIIEECRNA